jgi:hypothetical protein
MSSESDNNLGVRLAQLKRQRGITRDIDARMRAPKHVLDAQYIELVSRNWTRADAIAIEAEMRYQAAKFLNGEREAGE